MISPWSSSDPRRAAPTNLPSASAMWRSRSVTISNGCAAKAHLETHGVAIRRIENHRVSQSIYFADPDGNEIELYVDDDPTIWRTNPAAVATAEPFEL